MFFSGADLKPAFRLSRSSINMLVQMLPRQKAHGWSHEMEVLVTVYWLACGASYRVTADIFAMPLATVCRTVHNVVEEMMTILHRVIHFPKPEEMEEVGAGFVRLAGHEAFRCAAGAIDGAMQGICDAKGAFLDVYIGNTGSVHDALVLRRSPMYKQALYPPAGYILLGDGGYPCLQRPVAIMTPYRQPVASQVEARYNRHHAKARNIIERTFGILKTRWRSIFLRALEIRPLFAPKVIGACCILHNMCVAAGEVTVRAAAGSDVILPCSLESKENIVAGVFDWKKVAQRDQGQEVFLYDAGDHYNNGREGQSEQFRGRVSHFPDDLKHGNASIVIRNAKVADSGDYTCDFPHVYIVNNIKLFVGAAPEPSISIVEVTDVGVQLRCDVRGASPQPKLQWFNADGNVLPADEPQVSDRGDVGLQATVTSTSTNRFTCVATQDEIGHQIDANITLPEKLFKDTSSKVDITGWLGGTVLGISLVLVVQMFLVWAKIIKIRRRK
ncbi:uncharacterized protein LOC129116655, partial [Anoplopoma fimbria]|uniref:uncharacterized protein LOC129116655 n=1 Tax=Anoplopoma fimbria TaxID=229290 RepID=UPI0023ED92EF